MTPSPSMNPERSDAILRMLTSTIADDQDARVATRRHRRTRGIWIASVATAVVVIAAGVGYGVTAGAGSTAPGGGGGLAVPTAEPVQPTPSSTPTSSLPPDVDPAGTATPVPTPTPILDLTNPSTWEITFQGVGPLTIGGNQTAQAADMQQAFTGSPSASSGGETCPTIYFSRHSGVPNAPAMLSRGAPSGGPTDLVGVGDGALPGDATDLATFMANSPTTAAGIGVGSTLTDLRKAYPAIEEAGTGYETYYAISNSVGEWISFGVADSGRITTITVSREAMPPSEFCG